MPTTVEGRLCRLRPLRRDDMELVRAWRTADHVQMFFPTNDPISPDQQLAWFDRISAADDMRYWMIESPSGEGAGVIWFTGIDRRHGRAEWGYYTDRSVQRSGVPVEAQYLLLRHGFRDLGLHRIDCHTMAINKGVLNNHRRFGFVEEGVLRDFFRRDGVYHDVVVMSMLAAEFEAKAVSIETIIRALADR